MDRIGRFGVFPLVAGSRRSKWSPSRCRATLATSNAVTWSGDKGYLDLDGDIKQFQDAFADAEILEDSPVPNAVLQRLETKPHIGHFSCHGTYNHLAPLQSSLTLAEPLTLQTIIEHHQSSWLVNLSACETGIPDLSRTEQSVSFPTSFLMAGSAHVHATLWSAGNTHATEYNRHLYTQINKGDDPALAHQRAINELRNNPPDIPLSPSGRLSVSTEQRPVHNVAETDHPFWWAPYNHYGAP